MQEYMQFYINGEWVDPVTPSSLEAVSYTHLTLPTICSV